MSELTRENLRQILRESKRLEEEGVLDWETMYRKLYRRIEAVKGLAPQRKPAPVSQIPQAIREKAAAIIAEVARERDMDPDFILGTIRSQLFASARHEAMWRCHKRLALGAEQVGAIFNRNHATVYHAFRKYGYTGRQPVTQ